MRRKSERTASKKGKSSPEKKLEKAKRNRTRRRKQSSSSDNESGEDSSPVREVVPVVEVEADKKPPVTPVKEDSPEEAQSVWHVKTTDSSGDGGEIKKLKICLARPHSTPERADRSPRSRRKQSRATSSSDTASVEPIEDRRKSKRSKRMTRESNDSDKNQDSQGEEPETESEPPVDKSDNEISQSTESCKEKESDQTPMSTTNEEAKESVDSTAKEDVSQNKESKQEQSKSSDADTTVASPRPESQGSQSENNTEQYNTEKETQSQVTETESPSDSTGNNSQDNDEKKDENKNETENESQSETKNDKKSTSAETQKENPSDNNTETKNKEAENKTPERDTTRERSESVEKSEVLELHAEDSKCETSELESSKLDDGPKEEKKISRDNQTPRDKKVSITEEKSDNKKESKKAESSQNAKAKPTNDPDVVESSVAVEKGRKRGVSTDSEKDKAEAKDRYRSRDLERSDSTQSAQEETVPNGQAPPLVISRKRRWGSSRTAKLSTQKSITISTDVLKEIIPDVKPVEFEEVIEEKKPHKRVEVTEKIERPILPKIVIDNTENVELHKKEAEDKDKENVKARESNLAMNRKISIVKDNDSILTRPPSPPRYKQSNILYITNLVRPFTLPQLKNLLQRTGRLSENGFWIDRIKSKCFVKYETEDQAVETRHALHGVTWPVSNPKTLQVDFSTQEAFDKAKLNEDTDNAQASTIPGTVEDWLREQDLKRERGEADKPWERKAVMREWDVGKNDKDKDKDNKLRKDDRSLDKRRHRTPERSPEPAKKFKKKEEEAPAKLLDDLFRKTKTTPCIYWLPLSAETIAVKEEQRRQHMAEHERRLQELRRTGHRRH